MRATHRPLDIATLAGNSVPSANREEDGGLEPHPKGYSGLPTVKRSRRLAASSSASIRRGEAKFSPLDGWNSQGLLSEARLSDGPGVAPPHEKDPLRRVFVIQGW